MGLGKLNVRYKVQELVEGERMGNTARMSLVETRLPSDNTSQEVSYRVAGPDSVMEGLRVLGRMQREAKNFALLNYSHYSSNKARDKC